MWFKDKPSGVNPSSLEMLNTLSDLEYIYIRAKWTQVCVRRMEVDTSPFLSCSLRVA